MKRFQSAFLCLGVCGSLVAQVTPGDLFRFEVGQWTERGFLHSGFKRSTFLVRNGRKEKIPEPVLPETQLSKGPPSVPTPPRNGGKMLSAGGQMFFTALERGESAAAVLWAQDPINHVWRQTARLPIDRKRRGHNSPPNLFPLGNGKVLVLNPDPPEDCKDPNEWTPFAVFRKNERNELSLSSTVDPGLAQWKGNTSLRMDFGYLSSATIVDDLLVVCGWRYGLFWVFSLEDGGLKRMVRLYDGVTDEDIRQQRNLEVVVHFQPLKDGNLLVAARAEDSVKALGKALEKATRQAAALSLPDADPALVMQDYQFLQREREAIAVEYPFIAWYELDPRTGSRRRKDAPPQGGKEMLPSIRELDTFFWIPDERGGIRYESRDLSAIATVKARGEVPVKRKEGGRDTPSNRH